LRGLGGMKRETLRSPMSMPSLSKARRRLYGETCSAVTVT
jgi:hypothetical protein